MGGGEAGGGGLAHDFGSLWQPQVQGGELRKGLAPRHFGVARPCLEELHVEGLQLCPLLQLHLCCVTVKSFQGFSCQDLQLSMNHLPHQFPCSVRNLCDLSVQLLSQANARQLCRGFEGVLLDFSALQDGGGGENYGIDFSIFDPVPTTGSPTTKKK